MTHQKQQGLDYYHKGNDSTRMKRAYISIPMNLHLQQGWTIRGDIHKHLTQNGWLADWWIDGTSYEDDALKTADAVIFVLPPSGTSNLLAFSRQIPTLTRGIASEIRQSVAYIKPLYIAYYDHSKTVGIYNAKMENGLTKISGISGTRNTLFQTHSVVSAFPTTKIEERIKQLEAENEKSLLESFNRAEGKRIDIQWPDSFQAASNKSEQYPLTYRDAVAPTIIYIPRYYSMVKSRGGRPGSFLSIDLKYLESRTDWNATKFLDLMSGIGYLPMTDPAFKNRTVKVFDENPNKILLLLKNKQ